MKSGQQQQHNVFMTGLLFFMASAPQSMGRKPHQLRWGESNHLDYFAKCPKSFSVDLAIRNKEGSMEME
jgi:hypothetical protein